MSKKYIKNEKGIVRAVTSDNLQLEKPLLNENYDIEVHNRNMDKIDSAIQEVKGKIDGLELVASNVKMADGSTVQTTVTTNKSNITTLQSEVSANKTSILNNANLANQALNKANEAFLRGDNVKTQLVDKLISEGLDVSTNNTFEELISYISIGKKWASGSYPNRIVVKDGNVTVDTNLDFVPSEIYLMSSCFKPQASVNENMLIKNGFPSKSVNLSSSRTMRMAIKNVSKESFEIEVSGDSYSSIELPITWFAYE